MFKRRGLLLIIASLTLGVFAAFGANNWLNDRLAPSDSKSNTQAIVAAALEIPYGTKVTARHLRLVDLPPNAVPANSYESIEEVEGMVAKATISPGELLLTSKFVEHTQGSTLAALVTEQMRAVTVRVNDVIGVAGFLLPGNHVDVISIRGGRRSKATSEIVLHDVKVLAVDQTTSTDKNDPVIVRAVTLELSPKDALKLVKVKAEGAIQLTLRNPVDSQIALAEPEPEPEPVAKPKPVYRQVRSSAPTSSTIQVIRGTKVAREKVKI